MNDMLFRLGCPKPRVDCFATKDNRRCEFYFGEGGLVSDGLQANWNNAVLLWMNPPYTRLGEAVEKMIAEKAEAVMIMPDWKSESWWKKLQPFVKKKYFYPIGNQIFELDGKLVDGVRWGVWAYKVDTREHKDDKKDRGIRNISGDDERQKTESFRRRQRRKIQQLNRQ